MTRLGSRMPMPRMAEALKVKPPSRSRATGVSRKKDRMVMMENRLMLSREPFEPCMHCVGFLLHAQHSLKEWPMSHAHAATAYSMVLTASACSKNVSFLQQQATLSAMM